MPRQYYVSCELRGAVSSRAARLLHDGDAAEVENGGVVVQQLAADLQERPPRRQRPRLRVHILAAAACAAGAMISINDFHAVQV